MTRKCYAVLVINTDSFVVGDDGFPRLFPSYKRAQQYQKILERTCGETLWRAVAVRLSVEEVASRKVTSKI